MKKSFFIKLVLCLLINANLYAASLAENLQRDSDGDHISDAIELSLGLDPLDKLDGESDLDHDGLNLAEEINMGKNPNIADNDYDNTVELEKSPNSTLVNTRLTGIARALPPPAFSQKLKPAKNFMLSSKSAQPTLLKHGKSSKLGELPAQWSEVSSLNGWQPYRGPTLQVWQVDNNQFLKIGDGIKQPLKNLVTGNYILKWKQRRQFTDGEFNNYQIKISNSTGRTILSQNFKAINPDQWEEISTQFRITPNEYNRDLWLIISPVSGEPCPTFIDDVFLIKAGFDVDLNRDGKIDSGEGPINGIPFYFWINNDNDKTEFGGNDWSTTLQNEADFNDNKINSLRDLIDFFPVSLNFSEAIKAYPPDGQTRYILSQKDEGVNIVFTGLTAKKAGAIHQKITPNIYGDNLDQSWSTADVHPLKPSLELTAAQIGTIINSGEMTILVEGRKATQSPLVFIIERAGVKCLEISMPLHLDEVERMYRHLNLRDVVTTYDGKKIPDTVVNYGRPTEINNPLGWPDTQTSKKYLVFVHGFNITAQEARGWNNEMFKRFYTSGSQARFIGVTWRGDTAPDYHEAVFRAFQTGESLAKALQGFVDGPITIAAHSLGNGVAANAIQRGNLNTQSYLAINAAIPAEAYSSECCTETQRQNMTEVSWRKYDNSLYASYWNEIFPLNDSRSQLTWRNQFNKSQKIISNFYSGGDEVIAKANSVTDASIISLIINQGFNFSDNAWKYQELAKGVAWCDSVAGFFTSRRQAGWAFNDDWWLWEDASEGGKVKYTPSQAKKISPTRLISKPFFNYFLERELTTNQKNTGSNKATETKVIYDVLARGIPALTYAAGVTSLNDTVRFNYDLELLGRNVSNWPISGHEKPSQRQRWLHCDIKNVAFPLIYPTFQTMVNQGLLK